MSVASDSKKVYNDENEEEEYVENISQDIKNNSTPYKHDESDSSQNQ